MRLLRGMKQSHLAELLGVTQATVSRWERGLLIVAEAQRAEAQRLLAVRPDPAQDAALKRLVQSSSRRVHLICDRTHRLLAASGMRQAEWRADPAEFLGRSLLAYASPEIRAAEAALVDLGWHDGQLPHFIVDTGSNGHPIVPIKPGRVLWERIMLADGVAGRLVTMIA